MYSNQKGMGLVEVMVALLVLAIGVLGFSFLQLRALDASSEAMARLQAMNIARDLSERIRSNENAIGQYFTKLNATSSSTNAKSCIQQGTANACNTINEMADFDVSEVQRSAKNMGMTISMPLCESVAGAPSRRCIYVAWGKTTAVNDAAAENACTRGGSYLPRAQCVVMELY